MKAIDESLPWTFTTETARKHGVHPRDLYSWRDEGQIVELSRGVFRRTDAPPASYPDALAVAYRSPRAIVCCVSAAALHELTDEMPPAVQIAVPKRSHAPVIEYPPVTVFRFDESTFELGLSSFEAGPGEAVRTYNAARTVVDLMRFRHADLASPSRTPPSTAILSSRSAPRDASGVRGGSEHIRAGACCSRRRECPMNRPTRDGAAGRAYLDLQNRARREKRGTQELLTMYVVERWLARLSHSP